MPSAIDGNIRFIFKNYGRPLLNYSKTVPGIALAILVTAAAAELIPLDWQLGALIGSGAILGDLFSAVSSIASADRQTQLPAERYKTVQRAAFPAGVFAP
jgi:hypothetical protein